MSGGTPPHVKHTSTSSMINKKVIRRRLPKSHIHAKRDFFPFILCLPIEILEVIFIYCAYVCHGESSGSRTMPSWVNVSYVCRHWRNVALNCSRLWGYLFVVSPRWTEELLARSKEAPLKLFVYPDPQDNASLVQAFLKQTMKHVERIQELELDDLYNGSEHMLFPELSSRAPRLQNLTVLKNTPSSNWSTILFGGDTPSLRILELKSCPVPWYLFNLSGLTTLSLEVIPSLFQPNVADFLAMLSRMPDLIHLHLRFSLDSATDFLSSAAFHTFQKVNLPHLSCVAITAPSSTVFAFLSCINTPMKTQFLLKCGDSCDLSLDNYALLSSILQQRIIGFENQALSCPRIRSLAVRLGGDQLLPILIASVSERAPVPNIIINFSNTELHDVISCHIDNPLYIQLSFPVDPPTVQNGVLCDVLSSTPLTNIQSVEISRPPFSSAFWRKTLGHLPSLRHLKLSYGRMPDIAPLLSVTSRRTGTKKQGGRHAGQPLDLVLVPALVELELYQISLSATRLRGYKMDPPAGSTEALYKALRSRREHPGQLTMQSCVVIKDHDHWSEFFEIVERWEGGRIHRVFESGLVFH